MIGKQCKLADASVVPIPQKGLVDFPLVAIEIAYANESLPVLRAEINLWLSEPSQTIAAIGVKIFKKRNDGIRRLMVSNDVLQVQNYSYTIMYYVDSFWTKGSTSNRV
jgi:hypothetical protein